MDNNFRFERKFVINQNLQDIIIDIISQIHIDLENHMKKGK